MINLFNLFFPTSVFAQTEWSETTNIAEANTVCSYDGIATIKGFECLYRNVLQVIVGLAGMVFFAMFLVGGFKYLTSGGDPKKAAAATSTLTSALIGIIGVIIAWFVLLLITNFTGVDVTQFTIKTF